MARRKMDEPWVSPAQRARDIVAASEQKTEVQLSPKLVWAARRILVLAREHVPASALSLEEAPWSVWKWVAWGGTAPVRRQRAELAVHLRHTVDTAYGGWLRASPLAKAWTLWQDAVKAARLRGLYQPKCRDIPVADYRAAIEAAKGRSSQRQSPHVERARRAEAAEPLQLSPKQLAALDAIGDLVLARTG